MAAGVAECLAAVVEHLRSAAGKHVPLAAVRAATGVDLARSPEVLDALRAKADVELSTDGASARFIPPYRDLRDASDILALLARHPGEPVLESDVRASNPALAPDIARLVAEGSVIRLRNIDAQRSAVLFARTDPLLCPIAARATVAIGSLEAATDSDATRDVVRGDVVVFRGRAPAGGDPPAMVPVEVRARVSTATASGPAGTPCLRALRQGAHDSASPWQPHITRDNNPYGVPLTAARLPLALPCPAEAEAEQLYRHGVSADLRHLWRLVRTAPRGRAPLVAGGYPRTHEDLRARMTSAGIRPGPGVHGAVGRLERAEAKKRSFARSQASQAKRVRSVVVGSRGAQTNAHVAGTAVGDAIERARVRQAQRQAQDKAP